MRSFLSSYYYSKDGKFDFNQLLNITQFPASQYSDVKSYTYVEAAKNWIKNQKTFFTKEKLFLLKTHNSLEEYFGYRFTKSSETLGAIYIIRDPRNVVSSMSNHYSMNFNEMYNKMIDENASLSTKNSDGDLSNFSFLGSWSNHYKSWKNNSEFKTLFIKYEDLKENKIEIFKKIIFFINEVTGDNKKIDERKFSNAIKTTSFSNLKNKELNEGFEESVYSNKTGKKINFFNLGFNNRWQKILPLEIKNKTNEIFKEDLHKLGYPYV